MMLIALLASLLFAQDRGLNETTIDAVLRDHVAEARRGLPWSDPASGQTQTDVTLQGRTVTRTWTSDALLTLSALKTLEDVLLLGCEDPMAQTLMELGVVQRDVYTSNRTRFVQEQSARTCEAKDASTQWRTVRATPQLTVAVDASAVMMEGDRRTFELALFRAADPDGDGEATYRKEIHQIDCRSRTYARQASEIRDEYGEVVATDDEPRPARPVETGTPMDGALQGVCHGVWSDPQDRDLLGVIEASPTFGGGD